MLMQLAIDSENLLEQKLTPLRLVISSFSYLNNNVSFMFEKLLKLNSSKQCITVLTIFLVNFS